MTTANFDLQYGEWLEENGEVRPEDLKECFSRIVEVSSVGWHGVLEDNNDVIQELQAAREGQDEQPSTDSPDGRYLKDLDEEELSQILKPIPDDFPERKLFSLYWTKFIDDPPF